MLPMSKLLVDYCVVLVWLEVQPGPRQKIKQNKIITS